MFQLKSTARLVLGATRGAVLDLQSGKVYSVNKLAVRILTHAMNDESYWKGLCELDLAEACSSETETRIQLPNRTVIDVESRPRPQFIWLELVSDVCNLRCIHCYAGAGIRSRKALGEMRFEDWEHVLCSAYQLGCRRCQLVGGEPFLYKDEGYGLLDVVNFAHKCGYEFVEVFTNGTLLTRRYLSVFSELGTHVAVSLYSVDPLVHDRITRVSGSQVRTLNGIKKLLQIGIDTRVEMVVMKTNQDTVEETIEFLRVLGVHTRRPDPLRPVGRGKSEGLFPSAEVYQKYGVKMKPDFRCSEDELSRNSRGNACLNGKLAVSNFGQVFPCIFARDYIVGNVLTSDLEGICWDSSLRRVWNSTKDDVLVCKDCEYRYCCGDCRVLAAAGNRDPNAFFSNPYPRCSYNPYTGQWGQGTWKVDEHGSPSYEGFS